MKIRKPSKTIIITCVLVLLVAIYAIISSVNAQKQREASIPNLPSTVITEDLPGTQVVNPVDYSKVTITKDNVVQVISELKRPQSYYLETESVLLTESGTYQYPRKTWRQGDWQRIDILSSNSATTMHIIYGNGKGFYWQPNARSYYRSNIGDITADETQMMMTYEDILSLDPSEILLAEFVTYENQGCIHVRAQTKPLGYQTEYWVSTASGLLIAGQAKKNDQVFYTLRMTTLSIGEQEDVVFRLPDGTLAMNAS